jgi:hypothetical protein
MCRAPRVLNEGKKILNCLWCKVEMRTSWEKKYCSESCRGRHKYLLERGDNFVCGYCAKPFQADRKRKYCTDECAKAFVAKKKRAARSFDWSDRSCKRCNNVFTPVSAKQGFCSKDCRYQSLRENYQHKHIAEQPCVICKEVFTPKRTAHLTCSKKCSDKLSKQRELAKIKPVLCVTCGNEFKPKGWLHPESGHMHKYCSTECRTIGKGHNVRLVPKEAGKNKSKVSFNNCRICNTLFTARKNNILLCSDGCREKDEERLREEARIAASERDRANHTPKEITCKNCGNQHTTEYGDKLRDFCSKACSTKYGRRVSKATRRARIRGNDYETIDPFKVFARDKWSCRICGVKTPKRLRGTIEDNAPELDHIIPLAKGGPHIYENVQCACRTCNSYKSDKIIGQIPLFLYSNTA